MDENTLIPALALARCDIDENRYCDIKDRLAGQFGNLADRPPAKQVRFDRRWLESADESFAVFYVPDTTRIRRDLFLLSSAVTLLMLGVMDRPRKFAEFDEGYLVLQTGPFGGRVRTRVLEDDRYWPDLKKKIDRVWQNAHRACRHLMTATQDRAADPEGIQTAMEDLYVFEALGLDVRMRPEPLDALAIRAFAGDEVRARATVRDILFPDREIPWIDGFKCATLRYLSAIRAGFDLPPDFYRSAVASIFRTDILPTEMESADRTEAVWKSYDACDAIDLASERFMIEHALDRVKARATRAAETLLRHLTSREQRQAERYVNFCRTALDYNEAARRYRTCFFVQCERLLKQIRPDILTAPLSAIVDPIQCLARAIQFSR
jgi:hypothetical protein